MQAQPFSPNGTSYTLTATSVSSNQLIDGNMNVVRIANSGTAVIFIAFGTVSTAAAVATTGFAMLPGTVEVFSKGYNTYIAVITSTGSSTVYVTTGEGQ